MMNNYSSWNFHGEIVENIPMSNPSEAMVEDERVPLTSMHQLVHDAYFHSDDNPNLSENMDEGTHGQNSEAQDFYKLLNDADTELWPGCELTKLSFLVILFHIKSTNKWTNKSFTDLLGALQLAIPRSANLPKSYADANKVTKMLGLGYVQIHSCPNHNGKRLQTSISNSNRSATSGGHTEKSNNSGNVEGFRTQSDNPLEEGPEYEYEVQVQDSNGNRRRGKTILADIWNIPEGHQVVIEVNSEMQPIGDEGGVLGAFLGTIARNGNLCSLTYWRWDHLKKGLNRKNEAMILKEVQARFLYPKATEYWILKSIGHKWRDYKCYLKGKYYNEDDDIALLQSKVPKDVDLNQWVGLVNFWRSDEGKKRSKHGKESLAKAKVKPISTTGTKSHARVREEMRKKLEKDPTRTEVYLECHQHEKEAAITNQIKNIANGQGEHEVTLDNDPVSKILGKDQYGRVRGLGLLGVKRSDFAEPSIPSSCKGLNMSNKDEAAVMFYLRKLEGLTQRLSKRVKKQGKTIFKLKRKFQDIYGPDLDDDSDIAYSDSEEEQDSHHIPPNDKGQSTSSHSIDSPLPHHSTT